MLILKKMCFVPEERKRKGEIERERESKEVQKEARYIHINSFMPINVKLFYILYFFIFIF